MPPSAHPKIGTKPRITRRYDRDAVLAYVPDHNGMIWRTQKEKVGLVPTGARLTVSDELTGDVIAQGLVSAIPIDAQRDVWLAMTAWGRLQRFTFKPDASLMVNDLGSPADDIIDPTWRPSGRRQVTVAGLAKGPDGWLYLALSGYNRAVAPSGDCYIIRCRPNGKDPQMVARLNGHEVSYVCGSGAVATGPGYIYFVASHLTKDRPTLIVVETE